MTQSDIILTFFTIVYGLMLLELASRLHFLIRKRQIVKWHFLPILASWYVFILILKNWWYLSLSTSSSLEFSFSNFFFFGHLLIVIYLLTTSVLPDNNADTEINLKQFYFKNHKYFWGILSVTQLMLLLNTLLNDFQGSYSSSVILLPIFFLGVSILLALNKKYVIHIIGLSFFLINTIGEIISLILK